MIQLLKLLTFTKLFSMFILVLNRPDLALTSAILKYPNNKLRVSEKLSLSSPTSSLVSPVIHDSNSTNNYSSKPKINISFNFTNLPKPYRQNSHKLQNPYETNVLHLQKVKTQWQPRSHESPIRVSQPTTNAGHPTLSRSNKTTEVLNLQRAPNRFLKSTATKYPDLGFDDLLEQTKEHHPINAHHILIPTSDELAKLKYSSETLNSINVEDMLQDKDKEINYFVKQYLKRTRPPFDSVALSHLIKEWEFYRIHRHQLLQHRRELREFKRWQFEQYNRYLKRSASLMIHERAKQVNETRNFNDFKKLIFNGRNHLDLYGNERIDKPNIRLTSVMEPRLDHHLTEQDMTSAKSSRFQFPDGAGGGILADSLRPSRSREGRAVETDRENLLSSNDNFEHSNNHEEETEGNHSERLGRIDQSDSEKELRQAFEYYQDFKRSACQPRNLTLSMQTLLGLQQEHTTLLIPRGLYIQRCGQWDNLKINPYFMPPTFADDELDPDEEDDEDDYRIQSSVFPGSNKNDYENFLVPSRSIHLPRSEEFHKEFALEHMQSDSCECATSEEECLPLKVEVKNYAVAIVQVRAYGNSRHSTESIILTNHLSCGCLPRCANRLCFAPLKFIARTSSECGCICSRYDKRCYELLEGKQRFTSAEIPMPINGSYIMPPCRYGPMDDVHLYHRRCPRPAKSFPNVK